MTTEPPHESAVASLIVRLVAGLSFILAFGACGADDRSEALDALVTDAIEPTFVDFASSMADLDTAVVDLCASLDEQAVLDAGVALATARSVWSRSEPMWVGPVMERRSWADIDWPIKPDEIEDLITSDVDIDAEHIRTRVGADERGLQAVEYVLGDPADPAAAVAGLGDSRRCDYLQAVVSVAATEANLIQGDWAVTEGEEAARTIFVAEDSDAVDELVNGMVFLLEAMTDAELGKALGEMDREADPTAIVEGPAGHSLQDLRDHADGLRLVLVGASGDGGLSPLFEGDLTERLATALDAFDGAADVLDGPLATAVAERPADVSAMRAALKQVQVLVSTEVVSRLGVTIGFSDADGDSGG